MNLNRLKEIREDKDITQEQMAKILNISRGYYANLENNVQIITLEKLNTYINYFDVSFDYVLNKTNLRQYPGYILEDKIDYVYLGNNIKKLRLDKHYKQSYIENKLKLSNGYFSKLEKGKLNLSVNNLCKIITFFNVSADYVIRKKVD